MNVLVTPVGDQDPLSEKTNELGSVLTLAASLHHAFDRVFLLYTRHPSGAEFRTYYDANGNERQLRLDYLTLAEETRDALCANAPRIRPDAVATLPLWVANPTDYRQVFASAEQAGRSIMATLAQAGGPHVLHVSAASGTPALKAAMILLVSSGLLAPPDGPMPTVYQVADPRFVDEGGERVTAIDVTHVEAVRLIDHSFRLLEAEALEAARESLQQLAKIAYTPARRDLAGALCRYVAALQSHQRLAYGDARLEMNRLLSEPATGSALQGVRGVRRLIGLQIEALRAATASDDRTALLHDVLLNAERRQRHGEYADALARCWRVVEEALWWRLEARHGIPRNGRLEPDQHALLAESLEARVKERILGPQRLNLPLYIDQLVEIFYALNDSDVTASLEARLDVELRTKVEERLAKQLEGPHEDLKASLRGRATGTGSNIGTYDGLLRWVNSVRNCSVVAHGQADVAEVDAAASVALARQVVAAVAGVPGADHPFGLAEYCRFVQSARMALTTA